MNFVNRRKEKGEKLIIATMFSRQTFCKAPGEYVQSSTQKVYNSDNTSNCIVAETNPGTDKIRV